MAPRAKRGYQDAILRVLLDGQPHPREELADAGVNAVSRYEGQGWFQRLNPSRAEQLETLASNDLAAELSRQYIEGAKMLVGKALSHLVDRKLMEAVAYDDKGHRSEFVITAAGRKFLDSERAVVTAIPKNKSLFLGETKTCQFCGGNLNSLDSETMTLRLTWVGHSPKMRPDGPNSTHTISKIRFADNDTQAWAHYQCVLDAITPTYTPMQTAMLQSMAETGKATTSDLAQATGHSGNRIRDWMADLESRGIVVRTETKTMKNAITWALTDDGTILAQKLLNSK